MTHEQAIERLDDFASGELPDIDRRLLQRHLDTCEECRHEVAAIHSLLADASALPRGIAPPADLWAGIASRLESRGGSTLGSADDGVISLAPRRRPWQPPRWALQAAAAVVLVAGSSSLTALFMRRQATETIATLPGSAVVAPRGTGQTQALQGSEPVTAAPLADGGQLAASTGGAAAAPLGTAAPAGTTRRGTAAATPAVGTFASAPAGLVRAAPVTALAAFRPAEQSYQKAVDDLARVLETRRASLAPETAATLERNLRIIDAAINESRVALQKDPNSQELTRLLSASYDAKVQMLRQAVEL